MGMSVASMLSSHSYETVPGLCSLQCTSSRAHALFTIKSTSLLSHDYLNISWSLPVTPHLSIQGLLTEKAHFPVSEVPAEQSFLNFCSIFKFTFTSDLRACVVTKNLWNFPIYSISSDKGYCLYELYFAKHIHRDTKWLEASLKHEAMRNVRISRPEEAK